MNLMLIVSTVLYDSVYFSPCRRLCIQCNDTALKLITTPRLAELCDRSFRHSVILSASRITHERVMRSKIFII